MAVNLLELFCYLRSAFNRLRLLFRYHSGYVAILLKKLNGNPPERIGKINTIKKPRQLVDPLFYFLAIFMGFPDRFT